MLPITPVVQNGRTRQVNGERLDKWLCSKDLHPPCFAGAVRHLSRPHTTLPSITHTWHH